MQSGLLSVVSQSSCLLREKLAVCTIEQPLYLRIYQMIFVPKVFGKLSVFIVDLPKATQFLGISNKSNDS